MVRMDTVVWWVKQYDGECKKGLGSGSMLGWLGMGGIVGFFTLLAKLLGFI